MCSLHCMYTKILYFVPYRLLIFITTKLPPKAPGLPLETQLEFHLAIVLLFVDQQSHLSHTHTRSSCCHSTCPTGFQCQLGYGGGCLLANR